MVARPLHRQCNWSTLNNDWLASLTGQPDAALVDVLARHPHAPWAAALLQPQPSELPLLLPALLVHRGNPTDPMATPPAPDAAAAGRAEGSARMGTPMGTPTGGGAGVSHRDRYDGPPGHALAPAANICGRAALLAQLPWARVRAEDVPGVLAQLSALADALAERMRVGVGSVQDAGAALDSLLGVRPVAFSLGRPLTHHIFGGSECYVWCVYNQTPC